MGKLCGITVFHGDGTRGFFMDKGLKYTGCLHAAWKAELEAGRQGKSRSAARGRHCCLVATLLPGDPHLEYSSIAFTRQTEEEREMTEGRAVGQSGHLYRYCLAAASWQVCTLGCTADYLRSFQ